MASLRKSLEQDFNREMLLIEGYAVQGEGADVAYHITLRDAIHKILKSLD